MKHQRKIIAMIIIAYAGIASIMLINDTHSPIVYGLIVTILVTLILSLVFVTISMSKERKDKDEGSR